MYLPRLDTCCLQGNKTAQLSRRESASWWITKNWRGWFCLVSTRPGTCGSRGNGTGAPWRPCALLTNALCASVQKTNWTELINVMIFDTDRNPIYGPWSKRLRRSCWIQTGASSTAAKPRYLYLFIHVIIYYITFFIFISYTISYILEMM